MGHQGGQRQAQTMCWGTLWHKWSPEHVERYENPDYRSNTTQLRQTRDPPTPWNSPWLTLIKSTVDYELKEFSLGKSMHSFSTSSWDPSWSGCNKLQSPPSFKPAITVPAPRKAHCKLLRVLSSSHLGQNDIVPHQGQHSCQHGLWKVKKETSERRERKLVNALLLQCMSKQSFLTNEEYSDMVSCWWNKSFHWQKS